MIWNGWTIWSIWSSICVEHMSGTTLQCFEKCEEVYTPFLRPFWNGVKITSIELFYWEENGLMRNAYRQRAVMEMRYFEDVSVWDFVYFCKLYIFKGWKKKNTYHKSCYFLLNPLHASDPYPNSLKISEPEVFRRV